MTLTVIENTTSLNLTPQVTEVIVSPVIVNGVSVGTGGDTTALEARVTALEVELAALTARVEALETGGGG